MIFAGDPDFATVICSAHPNTVKAVKEVADKAGRGAQVQIELYGHWTFEDVQEWKAMGVKQVILHHSRDAKGGWPKEELDLRKKLCDTGMEVTATGGISYEDLDLFRGLPLFCFICGRSIRNAPDPKAEVLRMKAKIDEIWG
jgi:3-keto-L-gulonate-6-phosphate decarboxylase